jgi:L,D-transpeptidase YcbB
MAQNVDVALAEVEPPFGGYRRTQQALQTYENFARRDDGEQLPIPDKPVKPGDSYAGVPRLVRLLRLVGDLPPQMPLGPDPNVYEGPLIDALKRFQLRHGLDVDGRLDRETVKQLNIPLSRRVEQLRLTLERWRWVPHEFSRPPVVVNIPEFRLRALDDQHRTALSMKVVVGRAYRSQTPVFAGQMRSVIFRPYWNVPLSIQRAELVPKIDKDRAYVAKHSYEVVDRSGKVVDGGALDDAVLEQLRSGKLAIRQRPGGENALGRVKFLFPNECNVYLHDTPATQLFSRSRRDFSYGCIRVEDPATLAAWVLHDKPEWTTDRIRTAMNGDKTLQVTLERPIPVLIVYGTAFVEESGEVRFFDDIYGHDATLERVRA